MNTTTTTSAFQSTAPEPETHRSNNGAGPRMSRERIDIIVRIARQNRRAVLFYVATAPAAARAKLQTTARRAVVESRALSRASFTADATRAVDLVMLPAFARLHWLQFLYLTSSVNFLLSVASLILSTSSQRINSVASVNVINGSRSLDGGVSCHVILFV